MLMQSTRAQWPAVFLDIDGMLIGDERSDVDRLRLTPGAEDALALLAQAPLRLIMVNHRRDGRFGRIPHDALDRMEAQLRRLFAHCGAMLHAAYGRAHDSPGNVAASATAYAGRESQSGMLLRAQREHDIDLTRSWLIGAQPSDIEAGNRTGCRSILIDGDNETAWPGEPARLPYAIVANLHDAAQMIVERHAYEHPEGTLSIV